MFILFCALTEFPLSSTELTCFWNSNAPLLHRFSKVYGEALSQICFKSSGAPLSALFVVLFLLYVRLCVFINHDYVHVKYFAEWGGSNWVSGTWCSDNGHIKWACFVAYSTCIFFQCIRLFLSRRTRMREKQMAGGLSAPNEVRQNSQGHSQNPTVCNTAAW